MEKRLQDFIASVEKLADLRNLDTFNPIIFQMEKPATAIRFTIAGAKVEPSYLGLPINVTWVVLDPTDPYYLQALKLKDSLDTETVSDKPKVANLDAWWHVVRTYDEIFADPQYYVGTQGERGEQGPVGPTGPAGADGEVDVDRMLSLLLGRLAQLPGSLEIRGASAVPAAGSAPYELWLTEPVISVDGEVTTQEVEVTGHIILEMTPEIPPNTYMGLDNVLHAGTTNVQVPVKLRAMYPSWNKVLQAEKDLVISSKQVVSIAIQGANSIYAGATGAYSVLATYSDNSTAVVSASSWAVDQTALASISAAGTLSANSPIGADSPVELTASYNGLTATKAVTIKQVLITQLRINGANSVNGGESSTYTCTATLNDGRSIAVTPTWSVNDTNKGSITQGGVLTAANLNDSITVQASYTLPGTSTPATATKAVTIVSLIYPYYGTGPALPSDWQAFITSLPHRGPNASVVAEFAIDSMGANSFMYYAYPKSYGEARFLDTISQFFGGWGGAGIPTYGTNAATQAASEDKPIEVTININGQGVPFYVYRTEYANLGTADGNSWAVSARV